MTPFSILAERLLGYELSELGTGATEEAIADAERDLGVPIKGGYREFLRRFGWGRVSHYELFGLGGPRHTELVRVTSSERTETEIPPPPFLLPVMNNGAGDLICIDTRVAKEPPIVCWWHEDGPEQELTVEAGSFSSWLWGKLDILEAE